jgi:hypothetical protein
MTESFDENEHARFAELDGAYVLGALDPAERLAYERHLATCPRCTAAVSEIAGLPGLLSRVPVEHVVSEPESAPATLLPSLAFRARRDRRRRQVWTGLAVAAAVLVAAVLGGAVWGAARPSSTVAGRGGPSTVTVSAPRPTGSPVPQRSMQALVPAPVSATVALESTAWGTRVSMRCDHGGGKPKPGEWYYLWIVTRRGHAIQIGDWVPAENSVASIEGDTGVAKAAIARVEVRDADGRAVLALDL